MSCYLFKSINIFNIKDDEARTAWLNSESNIVNMFLIDARSNILLAARMISVQHSFAEKLRDILEEQANSYDSQQAVEGKIMVIQHTFSTADMIPRANMISL